MSALRLTKVPPPPAPATNTFMLFINAVTGLLSLKSSTGAVWPVDRGLSPSKVLAGTILEVPEDYQLLRHGTLEVLGTLDVQGEVVIL